MPIKIPQTLLGEMIDVKKASREDLVAIADQAKVEDRDFGRLLVEQNIISDADLLNLKSDLYKLPVFDLEKTEVNKEVMKQIPEDVINFYHVIPFANDSSVMKVGILNPEDINALEALKFIASDRGLSIEKYLISYKDFDGLIRQLRTLTGEVGKALQSMTDELDTVTTAGKELKLEEITAESPVTKIVAATLKHAVESRASDIHIEPFEDRIRTRFRIDGVLMVTLTLPKNLHSAVVTRIKIMSDLKIDETRLVQDGRFSIFLNKNKIDFRVSTFPTRNGEKVVMRILDPLSSKVDLVSLGIEGRSDKLLKEAMGKPFGCILITGPTGSGKSTTIAGILKEMNSEEINIVTLEDPIEYFIDGVNQSQIHEEIGYTFAVGLRHILRQDPDVVMVGEIRDRETAALATQAALTGHIVLSTLHPNDSFGVIPRLIDMGIEKYLIPPTMNLAVAQRLLRRLCQNCRVKVQANEAEEKIISDAILTMPKEYKDQLLSKKGYVIYKPNIKNACKQCSGKSYKGRVGIFEMMEMTDELEGIILGTLSESAMRAEGQRQGMITMFQDGIMKVLKGVVSLEELLEVAQAQDSA